MKRFFLGRSTRERALLLLLVGAVGAVWLGGAARRFAAARDGARLGAARLAGQQATLARAPAIEAAAGVAATSLAAAETLDATRLVGVISEMAAAAGLSAGIDPPQTEQAGPLVQHRATVRFRGTGLAALVGFFREADRRAPYVAIAECSLVTAGGATGRLDASFVLFSVEVAPP